MKGNQILPKLFIEPNSSFNKHIEVAQNNRILFSGKFGIGKTTFIEHYFDDKKEKYNVIHLFPVNYSVLDNEDIFKYIKYDIIIGLLSKYDKPKKEDIEKLFTGIPEFIISNLLPLFGTIALLSDRLGRPINHFIKELIDWKDDYLDYSKSTNEKQDDTISEFLKEIHIHEGGLYEYGHLTNIIINWLNYLKAGLPEKQNILVIDDLDRIDPNHIFRILNIFSSHYNTRGKSETKNKFGFDKIILVADIDNIKNIYKSQYGVDTDFNGYVDKFYSKDIYNFDNRTNIISMVDDIIDNIQIGIMIHGEFQEMGYKHRFRDDLKLVIGCLIDQNLINLRSIFRFRCESIDITNSTLTVAGRKFNVTSSHLSMFVYVLGKMIGSLHMLKEVLYQASHITNYRQRHSDIEGLIGDCAFFAMVDKLKFSEYGELRSEGNLTYDDNNGYKIRFNINSKPRGDFYWTEITSMTRDNGREDLTDQKITIMQNFSIDKMLEGVLDNIDT